MTAAPIAAYPLTHEAIEPVPYQPPPDHHERDATPDHTHELRLLAVCCLCGSRFNWCDAVEADVDIIKADAFRCALCRAAMALERAQ